MLSKVIELITGKDEIERIACTGSLELLKTYLEKRTIWIPQQPTRFLDPKGLTQQELMDSIQKEAEELAAATQFTPWVLNIDGRKRLFIFSSMKRVETFSAVIAKEMNKIFGLQCVEILLSAVLLSNDVDDLDLNYGSRTGMRIKVK